MTRMDLMGIEPLEDLVYRAWCREQCELMAEPCFVCAARDGTLVPHHVRGKRRFGDRRNITILCFDCHQSLHDLGKLTFYRFRKTSHEEFVQEAQRLDAIYMEIINGG